MQVSLSQYAGYQVVMLNSDGEILLNFQREYNMQKQESSGFVSMFKGFAGSMSKLKLNEKWTDLPARMKQIEKPLIDLDF